MKKKTNRYDALGSFERIQASCTGKGEQYIQAILDEITNFEEREKKTNRRTKKKEGARGRTRKKRRIEKCK